MLAKGSMKTSIRISPKSIFKANLILILLLVVANLIFGTRNYGEGWQKEWARFFSLDWEENLPTLIATLSLLCSSLLSISISLISELKRKSRLLWVGLGVIFLALSIDEWEGIHERIEFSGAGSWAYFYLLGSIVFISLYSAFVISLPNRIRNLMVISFVLFMLGSVGMELIALQALRLEANPAIPLYFFFSTVEEALELVAIAIFNYTLIRYFLYFKTVSIQLPTNELLD